MIDMTIRPPEVNREFATLVELLRHRALHQPDQKVYTFLADGEVEAGSLTFAELDQQARAIGAWLQSLGLSGERALLLYAPGLDYIAGFFGCLYAGVTAVPAYPPDLSRPERSLPRFQALIADAQARVALATEDIVAAAQFLFELAPGLRALQWLATDRTPSGSEAQWREPVIGRDTLAFLQYTSGSTRAPRGVMLSHGNLLYNSALIADAFAVTPGSTGVIWLPPYHDMGLIGGVLQPVYRQLSAVLMSPLAFLQRPLRWLQAISAYQASISGGPNFAYDLCVRKIQPQQRAGLDLSHWRLAFNGAEPVHPHTLERFTAAFAPHGFRREAFYPCYGLAEATLFVSGGGEHSDSLTHTIQAEALARHRVVPAETGAAGVTTLVACGHSPASQQIVIVNPKTLTQCAPDQVGEIWVSGASVAQGYWNRPEETEATFQATLADTDAGPFLRTGDLGFLRDGELFITGRLKDLIIIDGRNHYPQDIEFTVEQCHAAIRPGNSAAFAVTHAGEERLVIVAEVERSFWRTVRQQHGNGATPAPSPGDYPPDTAAVKAAVRRAVADEHNVRVHDVVLLKTGHIPKTSSGKIQRHACREAYLAGTLDSLEEAK